MRILKIGRNDAGQILDKFLGKAVKGLPQSLMYKFIRTKKIKVNGKRCVQNYFLCEGDEVQLYIRDVKGSCVRPVKELKGFEKIELDVGEEKTVSFEINEEMLKYWTQGLEFIAENGEFEVFIGKDSTCKPFAKFNLI